jgi:hypothetical protein
MGFASSTHPTGYGLTEKTLRRPLTSAAGANVQAADDLFPKPSLLQVRLRPSQPARGIVAPKQVAQHSHVISFEQ